MPGAHYALSEALIVGVGIWVAVQMTRRGMWLGALGTAIFSVAAAIGVIRFGLGRIDELAGIHQTVSQIGGAAAMALVAIQLLMVSGAVRSGWRLNIAVALAAITVAIGLAAREATIALFIAWLIIAIAASAAWPASGVIQRLGRAAVVAIFLTNVMLVRQSPLLGADLSWHAFHVLIAVWLLGLWWLLQKQTARTG